MAELLPPEPLTVKQIRLRLDLHRETLLEMGDKNGRGLTRGQVLDEIDALLDEYLSYPEPRPSLRA